MCGTARGHAGYGAQETRQAESSSGGTPLPSDIGICVPTLQSDTCRTSALERDKAAKHCCVHLPDGTSCVVAVKSGFSIKEILSGLCERHGINGAAVDLFLVGGDKVLCQTVMSHLPVSWSCLLPSFWPCQCPLLPPPLPPACEAVQLEMEAPRGSVGTRQHNLLSRGCQANFETALLFLQLCAVTCQAHMLPR